ncbi:YuzL family protein [Bacillus massilinigeriensis]|nr:YuzL family protein [Bacillus mediterraneensis]
MKRRKEDPSKTGISSPGIEGQGTTEKEIGGKEVSSSREKTKKH